MQATPDIGWLSAERFARENPLTAKIAGFQLADNRGKQDRQLLLVLESETDLILKTSVFGQNWNRLIAKLGSETDNWTGKRISILREVTPEGKARTVIAPF